MKKTLENPFKLSEFLVLPQLIQQYHCLGVVEAVFVIHLTISCQLTKLWNSVAKNGD